MTEPHTDTMRSAVENLAQRITTKYTAEDLSVICSPEDADGIAQGMLSALPQATPLTVLWHKQLEAFDIVQITHTFTTSKTPCKTAIIISSSVLTLPLLITQTNYITGKLNPQALVVAAPEEPDMSGLRSAIPDNMLPEITFMPLNIKPAQSKATSDMKHIPECVKRHLFGDRQQSADDRSCGESLKTSNQ